MEHPGSSKTCTSPGPAQQSATQPTLASRRGKHGSTNPRRKAGSHVRRRKRRAAPSGVGAASPAQPRSRVTVAIGDGDPIYLRTLERNLGRRPEFEVVAAAAGAELLAAVDRTGPAVLLVDHTTVEVAPSELFDRANGPTRVLLICSRPKQADVYDCISAGVSGFLAKDCSADELCHTVACLARGASRMGNSVQPLWARETRLRDAEPRTVLTDRERQILMLICEGASAPAMALEMQLGVRTVKGHMRRLFDKLGVNERAHAVCVAFRRGLIE